MHISAMVTIQVSAPEKRHIKDAYRFTGFTPLARLERLPNNTSHSESWAVTLRRREKKDGMRGLRFRLQELVRPTYKAYKRFGLRTIRHIFANRSTQGALPYV